MGENPFWWASVYPSVLAAYWRDGEAGLAELEERLRTRAAAQPGGKFSKGEAAYVPYVPLPPLDWDHECGRCRFWVDEGPGKPGECMIVGREGDPWGGKAIHAKAGCALFMPPAGEPAFGWLSELLNPTGADIVRGEYHPPPERRRRGRERSAKRRTSRHSRTQRDRLIPRGASVDLETVATGLTAPVAMAVDPDEDRRYVADQRGLVRVHDADGLRDEPLLDLRERLVELTNKYDERGLLGLALHPEFADNRRFYVRYSVPPRSDGPRVHDHTELLAEFEASGDGTATDLDSERILLEVPKPQFNHNSGSIAFGPDGYLYVALGDGGGAGDTAPGHPQIGNGQDVQQNLLGSILRIDVDGETPQASRSERGGEAADEQADDKPYAIPEDNPLVDREGLPEHYAWGLRNPWGMSFDSDGRLFVADVGQALYEEVNVVEKGGNYGWNVREGFHCFDPEHPSDPPEHCPEENERSEPFLDPIVEYPHVHGDEVIGSAVVGGYVYEGEAISELQGAYVFGDWATSQDKPSGRLFAATPPADEGDSRWSMTELSVGGREDGIGHHVLGFGRGADDELYVLTSDTHAPAGETGAIRKLVSASA